MNKKGFTLTELLIVVAIIGILAVIAIPAYVGQTKRAARTEAYTNLQTLRLLEEQNFAENGTYAAGATTALVMTALPGFRPGTGLNYDYAITQNFALTTPVPVPFAAGGIVAQNPCFYATATGIAGTRVADDVFAIDCNNNRNF